MVFYSELGRSSKEERRVESEDRKKKESQKWGEREETIGNFLDGEGGSVTACWLLMTGESLVPAVVIIVTILSSCPVLSVRARPFNDVQLGSRPVS